MNKIEIIEIIKQLKQSHDERHETDLGNYNGLLSDRASRAINHLNQVKNDVVLGDVIKQRELL